ncbi:MAG: SBBP repeat-containing protein, partial [Candidatus Aenigmarchaeota archaeon]|nr:SBBP repeat-containing protein [Candidatus Aenigmarchaeota archaeon]
GAYDSTYNGGQEVYVSKLNSDLTELVASTYLGGSERDGCRAVAVDGNGNVFLAGWTNSSDFPATFGAYDSTYNGGDGDAFVSKLDSSLTTLLASTFLGGAIANDPATCIRIDESGNVYVSGKAWSSDFPTTPGAYDETHGGSWDIFVSKFDNDLTTLSASTFLGGTSIDEVQSMDLDESANIYMTGFTSSSNFPTTPNAYDTSYADTGGPFWNYDVYVSSLDSSLSTLVASTFLGMIPDEEAYGIALDASGNVYVTGWTASDSFPTTPGAYSEEFNGGLRDAFISKFDANVTTLLASTFLGGSNQNDYSRSIAFNGYVYVTGYTHSSDFPTTPDAYDTSYNSGYSDAWVSKLDSNLTTLDASTYLGGSINPGVL